MKKRFHLRSRPKIPFLRRSSDNTLLFEQLENRCLMASDPSTAFADHRSSHRFIDSIAPAVVISHTVRPTKNHFNHLSDVALGNDRFESLGRIFADTRMMEESRREFLPSRQKLIEFQPTDFPRLDPIVIVTIRTKTSSVPARIEPLSIPTLDNLFKTQDSTLSGGRIANPVRSETRDRVESENTNSATLSPIAFSLNSPSPSTIAGRLLVSSSMRQEASMVGNRTINSHGTTPLVSEFSSSWNMESQVAEVTRQNQVVYDEALLQWLPRTDRELPSKGTLKQDKSWQLNMRELQTLSKATTPDPQSVDQLFKAQRFESWMYGAQGLIQLSSNLHDSPIPCVELDQPVLVRLEPQSGVLRQVSLVDGAKCEPPAAALSVIAILDAMNNAEHNTSDELASRVEASSFKKIACSGVALFAVCWTYLVKAKKRRLKKSRRHEFQ